jgi:hypothetical protein
VLKTNITDQERKILIAFNRESPILLVRLKAQAVMASDQGLSSSSIALSVDKLHAATGRTTEPTHAKDRLNKANLGGSDPSGVAGSHKSMAVRTLSVCTLPYLYVCLPLRFTDVRLC